jgi:DNA repair protein RecN (Recombination protein N)
MLIQLAVRDIVLIDRLDLDFVPGMTVLTGETGAGKSILLDAFSLALGGRGDGALVRAGAKQGQVTAVFDPPQGHPALRRAAEADIPIDGDLILRRVQLADGRTRAFVNDQPVSVQVLRGIGEMLVEIHGQHDDRALIDAATHRGLLDAFGGLGDAVAALTALWRDWRAAEAALTEKQAAIAKAQADADYFRHAAAELAKLDAEPGEEDELAARRTVMQQAEKVMQDLRDTGELLTGQQAPGVAFSNAMRRLERRGVQAPELIEPVVKALDVLLVAYDEAASRVDEALRACAFEPGELEAVEERLFALRGAGRKYNVPVDGLAALAEKFEADIAALEAGETACAALEAETQRLAGAYAEAAAALSVARRKAATALDKAVNAELPPLRLERARFVTELAEAAPGPEGCDRVEFWVQTNPGTRPGPMMKVASGGELSRFMLALKVALADRGSAPTLVFDEIDSGVGGAVSDAIGQRLGRLAETVQVLTVTHAPQVAARADSHLLIAKQAIADEERVATRVSPLAAAQRREDLARMLAGETVTAEARAAAERLLHGARGAITAS